MAQNDISPLRSDSISALWSYCSPHVLVFDLEALHALLETVGATTVGLFFPHYCQKANIIPVS